MRAPGLIASLVQCFFQSLFLPFRPRITMAAAQWLPWEQSHPVHQGAPVRPAYPAYQDPGFRPGQGSDADLDPAWDRDPGLGPAWGLDLDPGPAAESCRHN